MNSRCLTLLCYLVVASPLASAADKPAAFTPLFDGQTLAGWTIKGGTATYRVEDGAIVGRTIKGSKNIFLCTRRDYAA